MDLFIPYITVQPASPVNDSIETKPAYNTMVVPQNSEFQKIYFEELARKCYEEDSNFNAISSMARIRRQNHPLRASRRHRPGPRRADGSESRRAACQEGYFGRMSGRDSRYVVRIHRAGRGPRTVQGVVRIVGRAGVAVRNSHFYRGGCRGGGSHRLSCRVAACVHVRRHGRRFRRQRAGASRVDAQRPVPLARASGAYREKHQGLQGDRIRGHPRQQ